MTASRDAERADREGIMKEKIKKVVQFFANPRLLLCLGIAWIITNGWSYVLFAIGTWLNIKWMIAVGGGYLTFLWLPISPEKIITVAIAIFLLKALFPKDQKTLAVLVEMRRKVRGKIRDKKKELAEKKAEKESASASGEKTE